MLVKKYYDGTQIRRIISEEVKDYDMIMKILKRFADEPSAQLGTNLAEVGTDCISRQAAIDAVSEYGCVWMEYSRGMTKDEIAQRALNSAKATMIRIVKELPSAQPMRKKGRRKQKESKDGRIHKI